MHNGARLSTACFVTFADFLDVLPVIALTQIRILRG